MKAQIIRTGFSADGSRYHLTDPQRLLQADADLWNDRMYLQIDQRGQVLRNGYMTPSMKYYSSPLRSFYLRDLDRDETWSVPQGPIRTPADDFLFSAGKSDLLWKVTLHGIECVVRVLLPLKDRMELWSVEVVNRSEKPRSLALTSYLPFGRLSWLRQSADLDVENQGIIVEHFPYYVEHEDYESLKDGWNQAFVLSDRNPDSCMCSITDFIGHGSLAAPDALALDRLGPTQAWGDADQEHAGLLQYQLKLKPGESSRVHFAMGPAQSAADIQKARDYLKPGIFEGALAEANALYTDYLPALEIQTPDKDFDAYMNHWQSRRSLMLVRGMRFMAAPQGRNLLQDAMAGALMDPACSRKRFLQFYAFQHTDGWMPHGMPLEPGGDQIKINTIPHKDINSWGPACLCTYMYETGDMGILDEPVAFADDDTQQVSLYEHICLGLNWLLADRTERGLSRIGQGDWNDPLNMAGCEEKGESVWLSEALVVALEQWIPVCKTRGDDALASEYQVAADELREKINSLAWDGNWYLRGFTDAGKPFGTHADAEGRIFLNAQSWAMMAGVSDEARTASCIEAVDRLLNTPSGPMTLAPAFTGMRKDIGKLTLKIPGRLENGSVYCHAVTFYAYALYQMRRPEKAFDVLRNLVGGTEKNPLERTGQLPLYIPNAYFGTPAGSHAGKSTHSSCSGTAAWFYRTVMDQLFGLRAEMHGLRIDPQLPVDWNKVQVVRRWRGSTYQVQFLRDKQVSSVRLEFDGEVMETSLIPADRSSQTHQLIVTLPVV
ncbi:hypothetical protein P0Y35_17970 [Kiritimatiellaeota bacterium B1221]|nr:hypothetical protein [Kiritimatiellaeota bacterium B1221]